MDSPNLIGLLRLLHRWRKPILIVTGLALLASIVVSDPHIMPPKFKSQAVILAGSPNMTSSQFLFVENSANYFGGEDDIDRLLTIANSIPLKQYIVSKYKLFEHYGIDSARTAYPNTKVYKELEDNYSALKNDKGAIEITLYDTDRELAARMCNDIVAKIDDINNGIILDMRKKILNIYQEKIRAKEMELRSLTDTIVQLRERSTSINRLSDLRRVVSASDSTAHEMATVDEALSMLEERKKSGLRELNNTVSLAEQYESSMGSTVSSIFILDSAQPAERKSTPIRWLIVLCAVAGAFILSLTAVALIERIKAIQWQAALQDA